MKNTIAQLALSRTAFFILMAFGPAASIGLNILDLLAGSSGISTILTATFYAMLGLWILAMLTILLCLVCPPIGTYAAHLMNRRNTFLAAAHAST